MIIIGERINGMFSDIKQAIIDKNKKPIQDMALKQVAAGADVLDINVGVASSDPEGAMAWLVETVQEVTDIPLAIDSIKPNVSEAGLKVCKNKAIINSTTGAQAKLDAFIPLALKYNAGIIGLALDERGVPATAELRCEIALNEVMKFIEAGIDPENIYLDPIVQPMNVAQNQGIEVVSATRQFKLLCDPPPKVIVGLSNISQGTLYRELVNRTYLAMLICAGLDGAIMDVLDKDLVDTAITSEMLMNKHIYCDSYLDAYRKK